MAWTKRSFLLNAIFKHKNTYIFKKREVENTTRKTNFELLDAIETLGAYHLARK